MTETMLYFIRHGQTEWNVQGRMQGHRDSELTVKGRRQAERLAERLSPVTFDALHSSTSPRAVSTARLIRGERSEELRTWDALKEINMGVWEGESVETIRKQDAERYRHFWEAPHLYRPSAGGESYEELLKRTLPALEKIAAEHAGGHVLIVTHRITLRTVLGHYEGKSLRELGELPDLPPASLSLVRLRDGKASVELYGDASHDKD
ncbi:histidine phosphatase family protein [Paenibacillus hodogayensis]|uniref:Histidine phosphatase family protein n=1 Tax=Paenibacillus hodogayensis TaxID=279208 RepID=A0ABV5VV93_9BACL